MNEELFIGALADNKFNRILDNDRSESVDAIFLITQHFPSRKNSRGIIKFLWKYFLEHKTSGWGFLSIRSAMRSLKGE